MTYAPKFGVAGNELTEDDDEETSSDQPRKNVITSKVWINSP